MMCSNTSLVLEGGGMRGLFTTGVLDFFMKKDLYFDNCIGVSAGACHATSYLSKQYRRSLQVSINYLQDKRYCSIDSLLKTGNLFGAEMLYDTIPRKLNPIDNETFVNGKTTFKVAITNCITGEAEYPLVKDFFKDIIYIRASSSLPFVSRLVMINNIPYLDGGIADSIPIKYSISEGNTKNVVVLTQPKEYRKEKNSLKPFMKFKYHDYPKLIEKLENRHIIYNNTLDYIYKQEKLGNIFVIQPPCSLGIRRVEKDKQKLISIYKMGFGMAERSYRDLQKYLGIR